MREEIAERVRGIVAVQLDVKLSELRDDASLMADLGADSFGLVELCLAIEEAFDLEIPDAQTEQLRTVGDAIAYVASRTQ
ncbi:acyl carrier protein [Nannocystis sp.]|uniref:acyl carrier protein n=1 Tax=Nannocystis sp. TaxID=1962667 RepID=UPI002421AEB9|nr:acyl carrier protein [Nannocystis sp.]MBK7824244.1 acyl carrier protein [Nannocystis sp.]MBK9755256.1 acyl carrier protein [Nannocystis sp.]